MKRAAILVCCVATAHAETRPEYAAKDGGKVEASLLGAPATFDPAAAQTHAELTVVELVFDTLYRIELGGTVAPHLAAGPPELDAAKLIAKIAIRRGVKFHDNATVLTADDVAASLERARTGAGRWALAPIASVKPNGDSIEIVLKSPTDIPLMLSLAPSAVTWQGKPPGGKPMGTGPFRLESVDRGASGKLVLKAFEGHFAGRTYINELTLRWHDKPDAEATRFETDASQLSARGFARFATSKPMFGWNTIDGPKSVLLFVGFGAKHAAITNDVAFRRALDLALDRRALASVNRGEAVKPAGEPVPVESGGASPSAVVVDGDLVQAKAALATAAARVPALRPPSLPQLALEISFEESRPDDREIAERVAHALDKLGIGTSLAGVSASELSERAARGTTDLWIGQLAAPLLRDTWWPWWSAAFAIGGSSWAMNALLAGDLQTAKGHQLARTEFAARRPIVPLMFRGIKMHVRNDIRGLRFDAVGRPCFAELFMFGQPVRMKP